MALRIEPASKRLFFGDSITSAGRYLNLPGEGRTDDASGSGYVLLLGGVWWMCKRKRKAV